MDFKHPVPVTELASTYSLQLRGKDTNLAIGINEIHKVRHGDITFVDVEKYYLKSLNSDATIILINKDITCPPGKTLLITDDPFAVYNQIVWENRPLHYLNSNRGENLQIGEDSQIDFGAYIGHDVTIGKGCYIQSGAYIGDHTIIGDNVSIQAGALIGTDAFYYKKINGKYTKWRSGGKVIIQDNVEIGAGCTINRGVSGDTVIGNGTKLDCQVHIGHGVVVGSNCLIAAQTGIAGKTIIGSGCVIYGQVGIAQNLKIGDNVVILAKSGISKNLLPDKTYFGIPADDARIKMREMASVKMLKKNHE
ncbi:MAG TPA: UDP-3-O-(3-hydroxymyristoyl)glucosamine N-acyltransferase [Saprospiraceae bacterium]|jgi:UDP-3-O-[3-hydroxymyristoyl] glucosamine N-acyltransferase|nr:UDP-3-O-(3-hydroxymyristoyl)glucosamine N-acyltransferase [Saprospiraceae bacterium]HRO08816.1 UDP-3-O-(3-hydroxymyristoyl)glucosamine N-acyltransferase [Saprospiraceae bacterium]HRP42095.1 UDP-3-O-(3-hydroxymyristoyl)glucosamine N-acyltransferase [Saprospiraceae bacterium]